MDLQNWSRQQISNLIANYERLDRTEGGPFTKAQVILELERRGDGDFDGRDVTQSILEIRDKALNGSLRYLDIWTHYFPDQPALARQSLRSDCWESSACCGILLCNE